MDFVHPHVSFRSPLPLGPQESGEKRKKEKTTTQSDEESQAQKLRREPSGHVDPVLVPLHDGGQYLPGDQEGSSAYKLAHRTLLNGVLFGLWPFCFFQAEATEAFGGPGANVRPQSSLQIGSLEQL